MSPSLSGHTPSDETHNTRENSRQPSARSPDNSVDAYYHEIAPDQPRSLAGIALRSFLLGGCFIASLLACVVLAFPRRQFPSYQPAPRPYWRAPFFLASLSLFHFLEFFTTALANTRFATISAFLLSQNGRAYNIAHLTAMLECIVTSYFAPAWQSRSNAIYVTIGLFFVVLGQAARSIAMLTAGASFNHTIQTRRSATHVLITTGIYKMLRHPSYFGFFWWALGTQLVIGNTLALLIYAIVLWNFFHRRVRREEELLVEFFGEEYIEYRKRSWVGIPFVGGQLL